MEELKKNLESAKMALQVIVDERPAASVSRISEAEQAVKVAEEALKEAELAQPKEPVKRDRKAKGA